MTEQFAATIFERLGWAGLFLIAVYILAHTLRGQYEARIAALEKHAAACDLDRVDLRKTIITMQQDIIKDYQRRDGA